MKIDAKTLLELDEKEYTEDERLARAGDVEVFYNSHFKELLAHVEVGWLRSMGKKDWTKEPKDHAVFHQGALHCLEEIRQWFEAQVNLSRSRFDKGEEPEGGVPKL